ncbi:unnamed protein product, partial [Porites evermanni]
VKCKKATADSTLSTITWTGEELLGCHVFEADRYDSREDTSGTSRCLLRLLRTVKDNDDDLKADILNELTSLSTKGSKLRTCQAEVCQCDLILKTISDSTRKLNGKSYFHLGPRDLKTVVAAIITCLAKSSRDTSISLQRSRSSAFRFSHVGRSSYLRQRSRLE